MAIKRVDPSARFNLIAEMDDSLISETPEELAALVASRSLTRYEDYLNTMDESKLKFAEGSKPSRFRIRCITNVEFAEIQARYFSVDPVTKTSNNKNLPAMALELFNLACESMEDENGVYGKVTANDLGYGVATSVGMSIYTFTALGKHLKK